MSQVYRAHPSAQAIEEAVVVAAALLAVVEAAPILYTTPSRGVLRAADALPRKLWTTLAVITFAALAGAAVFGGGRDFPDEAALGANVAPSSAAPASAVEHAIAVAEPERVIEADVMPPSEPKHAMDATKTTTTRATPESAGLSTSMLKEPRKASRGHRAMIDATLRVASASLRPTLPK